MKKIGNSKIFFIMLLNVCILLIFILNGSLTPSEILKPEEFVKSMEKRGCTIINMQEKDPNSGIETYLVTDSKSCPYLFAYTIFKDENLLRKYSSQIENDISGTKDGGFQTRVYNDPNKYYEYSIDGNEYKKMTRVKNSVLYTSVDSKYKAEAANTFEELNYIVKMNLNVIILAALVMSLIAILVVVILWKIEEKVGNPGWIILIPIYNLVRLFKDVFGSGWYFLPALIPGMNIVIYWSFLYKLGKVFGKKTSHSIILAFFPTILLPLIAFDHSVYHNPKEKRKLKTIGIEFNSEGNILNKLFKDINFDNYIGDIVQQEALFKHQEEIKLPSIIKGSTLKSYLNEDYFFIFLNLRLYPKEKEIVTINNLQDYMNSECQIMILIHDVTYLEIYSKNQDILEKICNVLKKEKVSYTVKTEENDNRTEMYV